MPWANGRGMTTEMVRVDGPQGLLWRLSMASVTEDGPFSVFPGIERSLTVISGPGFDLVGERRLRADPFVPVAFPGDIALQVKDLAAPCEDVNVLTTRRLPRPDVSLAPPGTVLPAGGLLCVFALDPVQVNGLVLARHDLCIAQETIEIGSSGRGLVVRLYL
jgi:hypothetical protein